MATDTTPRQPLSDLPCPQCKSETDGPHCLQPGCTWRLCTLCHIVVGTREIAPSAPNLNNLAPSIPTMPMKKPA
jgi:hypothetical protein